MGYDYVKSKPLNSSEKLIYIAFVGDRDLYQEMISKFMDHEGYCFVYVDTLTEVDTLSIGEVDSIVIPAEMECDKLPESSANLIRVTKNKDLLCDDIYLISDDLSEKTRNVVAINEKGEKKFSRVPISYTEIAMDYVIANSLFKRRQKLLEEFKDNALSIVNPEGKLDEDRLIELFSEKDATALGHIQSVASLVTQMGFGLRALGVEISDEELEETRKVGLIHDLGKLYTPDQLLKNTDSFYPGEYLQMQRHAEICYDYSISEEISQLINLAGLHHYRYDGKGYSGIGTGGNEQHIQGDKIPLAARMMITLDAFDAITDISRGYQMQAADPISPLENAINILCKNSGSQFDPLCAHAFLVGFRESFMNDRDFQKEWIRRELVYHEKRREHLSKHPNLGTIEPFDPVKRVEFIEDTLNNNISNLENLRNTNNNISL